MYMCVNIQYINSDVTNISFYFQKQGRLIQPTHAHILSNIIILLIRFST